MTTKRSSPCILLTSHELTLLTASPGRWISPLHPRPLKDSGRGISLTAELTMCTAEKYLSVLYWPLWLRGDSSNKSLLLSVSGAAMPRRSAENRYAEWGGAVFTVSCLTITILVLWAVGELGNPHWDKWNSAFLEWPVEGKASLSSISTGFQIFFFSCLLHFLSSHPLHPKVCLNPVENFSPPSPIHSSLHPTSRKL